MAFPDLTFVIGGKGYHIPVQNYVDYKAGRCQVKISPVDELNILEKNLYILSISFFEILLIAIMKCM